MKKLSKKVLALIIAVTAFFSGSAQVFATEIPKSLRVGSSRKMPEYVSGLFFNTKTLADGTECWCLDIHKTTTANTTVYLSKELDSGMAYLIENGYPYKSFTGNKDKDMYITQMAVWWYLDDTTGSSNLWYAAKYTSSDPYNLRSYVKKLVSAAKQARQAGYPNKKISASIAKKEMTIGQTKKYYISDQITVDAPGNYTVSLTGAPSGSFTADVNGNVKTTFSANEKFNVYVPVANVKDTLTNLTVNISSSYSYNKVYEYKPNNNAIQNVVPTYLFPVTKQVSTSISLSIFKSRVTITKYDASTNKQLKGATLVLKDVNGNVITEWVTTGSVHVVENLPKGTYTLQETKAPEGYDLNTEVQTFKITDTNRDIALKLYNHHSEKETIKVIKLDKSNNNKPLAGATLVVKNSKGEEVAKWVTTTDYKVFTNLEKGNYTVQEVAAPEGYVLDTTPLKFTVAGKKKTVELKLYNKLETRVVRIIKLDKSNKNKPLAGATLVVKNSKGEEVAKWVTTTDYKVFTNLPKGDYTVQEIEAPKGYKLNTTPLKFTVTGKKQDVELKFYNTLKPKSVSILKVDSETGNTVSGAVLIIKNSDGKEIARFTTTDQAYVISNIENGIYYVSEVQAPDGYNLSNEIVKFEVTNSEEPIIVTFKNNKKPDEYIVPDTASDASIIFYLIGGLMILSTVGFVRYNAKER